MCKSLGGVVDGDLHGLGSWFEVLECREFKRYLSR